jgi:hypothetical protein
MVQGTNGVLYGPTFLHKDTTNYYSYFSLSASGTIAKQYPFPGQWGSAHEPVLAPPGVVYDIAAQSGPSNKPVYALAQIQENGQITILPQFPAGAVIPAS